MANPQTAIGTPDTAAAIFLVLAVRPGGENAGRVVQVCGELDGLVRAVAARDAGGNLSAIVAFGSDVWDRLFGPTRPVGLHPFRELRSGNRHAPSTPGDVLFHIRGERMDLCFELAAQITAALADSVTPVDEVHGFRYFDDRDLIGFVDGTENPAGDAALAATIGGPEDAAFEGGSYVIVQRYLHDLPKWRQVATETQEKIIGRTKLEDVELNEATKPSFAHNALTTLVENGQEIKIFRNNMPFGNISGGDAGTYFIAYARSPHPIERMLEKMFLGDPPGNYDRLLDFTRPVTGSNFFAPSMEFLASPPSGEEGVEVLEETRGGAARTAAAARREGMLEIGSLKGVPQHE